MTDSIRIVLVEDDPAVRRVMERLIRRASGRVHSFAGAQAALRHMEAHPLDLLITDLEMPDLDGAALIAAMRSRQIACRCVLISGRGEAACEARLAALGIVGVEVVSKPITPAVMRRVLAGQPPGTR